MTLRVFVVDDSSFTRKALTRALTGGGQIEVVGTAANGREALGHLAAAQPDVVTLDVQMPGMSGLETLQEIVRRWPKLPVIMISSHTQDGAQTTMEALALGAVDFIDKSAFGVTDIEQLSRVLFDKLRIWLPRKGPSGRATIRTRAVRARLGKSGQWRRAPGPGLDWRRYDLCVMAASTGGPPAIEAILTRASPKLPPIVIVQHMPVGFTRQFAERLNGLSKLEIAEAEAGVRLVPGTALIAPAGRHLRITPDLSIALSSTPSSAHIPSADVLMTSAAAALGARVCGVLLTGMGEDGAEGMFAIHQAGGMTVAEDEASCVVYGMPRAAHARGAVAQLLSLEDIVELFMRST